MKVGFLGLGAMGSAMATNVLQGGNELHVWNRTEARPEPLAKLGAHVAREARELAHVEVALAMFADDDAFRASVFESGLFEALDRGAVFVNMATVSVAFAEATTQRFASVASPMWPRPFSGVPTPRPKANSTFSRPATMRDRAHRAGLGCDGPEDVAHRRQSAARKRREDRGELHDRERHRDDGRSLYTRPRLRCRPADDPRRHLEHALRGTHL